MVDASCGACVKEQHPDAVQEHDTRPKWRRFLDRERRLITAVLVLVVLMNTYTGRYILYPFVIFSTWIHEMCHGLAAIVCGGKIHSLHIFSNGSGLAYTSLPGGDGYSLRRAFVASAGYTGTSIAGGVLLLFRRTIQGPKIGTVGIGAAMVLSCIFWVRNTFGLVVISIMGVVLTAVGFVLKAGKYLGTIYTFLAATACLNAITSIHYLLESDEIFIDGEERQSDADTVAEYLGMTAMFWAICWLFQSVVMLVVGVVFGLAPSKPSPSMQQPLAAQQGQPQASAPHSYYDVTVV